MLLSKAVRISKYSATINLDNYAVVLTHSSTFPEVAIELSERQQTAVILVVGRSIVSRDPCGHYLVLKILRLTYDKIR